MHGNYSLEEKQLYRIVLIQSVCEKWPPNESVTWNDFFDEYFIEFLGQGIVFSRILNMGFSKMVGVP
jgi:hypothetical protein